MNVQSARNVQEFCYVWQRDEKGRANVVYVPGHEGRRYAVSFRRLDARHLVCRCLDPDEAKPCPGNSHGKICYHVLAAAMCRASAKGYLHVFDDYEQCMRVEGWSGHFLELRAEVGGGS